MSLRSKIWMIVAALSFAAAMAGCARQAEEVSLANTKWRLVAIGAPGTDASKLASNNLTLEFDDAGSAGGSSGCNTFGGSYKVTGDAIDFGEFRSTLMACEDPAVMQLEFDYLQALGAASRFEVSESGLAIFYGDSGAVLTFVKQ